MREIRAFVRSDCLSGLVHALQQAEVSRIFVSKVHALGAGVDPEDFKVSIDEGDAYTAKARVEFLCAEGRIDEALKVIQDCARTGHRGDGIVVVSEVLDVISIRTGDRDKLALT